MCRAVAALALMVLAAACAPVPLDQPKPVSRADTPPPPTSLGQDARSVDHGGDARSTFVALPDGNQALGARLRLIEAAERTLDLQYFLMKPDLGGALVADALLRAADRGVRVRLLLDDVFTTVKDRELLVLDAHPDIALRIFNPAPRPGSKAMGFVTDFRRVNRRMHNKSFVADGAFAIIGGRNIADEYYQLDTSSEFADFDMLAVGPVVAGISDAFDRFWNDGWAVPMDQLRKPASAQDLADMRTEMTARLEPARSVYDGAVNDPHLLEIIQGVYPVYTGAARVVTDDPSKLKVPLPEGEKLLAETLLQRMRAARSDVFILTPYFVPEDYGARLFSDLAQRGVRVRIVTNSLGSTNHPYVHAGYRRHRVPLLRSGVELYEVRGDALQALGLVDDGDETGVVMHTKLAVIDGQDVFVGSLNLDPRSIKQNTELGVLVRSPRMASAMIADLERGLIDYTYRLRLTDEERLEWVYDGPAPTVAAREPGTSFWNQLVVGVTELLGVELLL